MSKPNLGKFKYYPVVILPDDCPEYIPGQPLPPGAILNTPLPNWVYIAVVVLVAVCAFAVVSVFTPTKTKPTLANALPTATSDRLVFVSFVTYTPVGETKPDPTRQSTPAPANFKISLYPLEGVPGEAITVTVTSDRPSVYSITWDKRPLKNGELEPGTNPVAFYFPAEPGQHDITVDVIAANTRPERQTFLFEVKQ